jgi:hypothetical protein
MLAAMTRAKALVPALLAAALVAGGDALTSAQPAAAAGPQLHWTQPPSRVYRVLVPVGWRYRNATYPSDHSTEFWFSPTNPLEKLEVISSGCEGCVSVNYDGHTPNPYGMLPDGVFQKHLLNRYVATFSGLVSDDPYPMNGVVVVTHQGTKITGSWVVSLWLPYSLRTTATQMLNGFLRYAH